MSVKRARGVFRRLPDYDDYGYRYFIDHYLVAQYKRLSPRHYSVSYHHNGNAVAYANFAVDTEREARALCRRQDSGSADLSETCGCQPTHCMPKNIMMQNITSDSYREISS